MFDKLSIYWLVSSFSSDIIIIIIMLFIPSLPSVDYCLIAVRRPAACYGNVIYLIELKKAADGSSLFCSFAGNETSPESFLLHNALARKPKRIRTAFSPSQLLRLEHAFEKNHYVVGAERKQLAHSLSLTETQVRNTIYFIQH